MFAQRIARRIAQQLLDGLRSSELQPLFSFSDQQLDQFQNCLDEAHARQNQIFNQNVNIVESMLNRHIRWSNADIALFKRACTRIIRQAKRVEGTARMFLDRTGWHTLSSWMVYTHPQAGQFFSALEQNRQRAQDLLETQPMSHRPQILEAHQRADNALIDSFLERIRIRGSGGYVSDMGLNPPNVQWYLLETKIVNVICKRHSIPELYSSLLNGAPDFQKRKRIARILHTSCVRAIDLSRRYIELIQNLDRA